MRLLICIALSLSCQALVNSDFYQVYIYDNFISMAYYMSIAITQLLFGGLSIRMSIYELRKEKFTSCIFIGLLAICMITTALFNLSFAISPATYYLINEFKSGPGFSWRTIYLTVEISAIFIMLGNGFANISSVDHDDYSLGEADARGRKYNYGGQ